MRHKHAELMLAYALDAMETDKPWKRWYAARVDDDTVRSNITDPVWTSEYFEYFRKADAPPVPWHLLDRYVQESVTKRENNAPKSVEVEAEEHKPECSSLNKLLLSNPPQKAPCDCGYETPTKKPVDLSVLIGSGIDFEDKDGDLFPSDCSTCAKVEYFGRYETKPRMNYWFSYANFGAPCEVIGALSAAGFALEAYDGESEFIGQFRIIGIHPDRCWPWEVEE